MSNAKSFAFNGLLIQSIYITYQERPSFPRQLFSFYFSIIGGNGQHSVPVSILNRRSVPCRIRNFWSVRLLLHVRLQRKWVRWNHFYSSFIQCAERSLSKHSYYYLSKFALTDLRYQEKAFHSLPVAVDLILLLRWRTSKPMETIPLYVRLQQAAIVPWKLKPTTCMSNLVDKSAVIWIVVMGRLRFIWIFYLHIWY